MDRQYFVIPNYITISKTCISADNELYFFKFIIVHKLVTLSSCNTHLQHSPFPYMEAAPAPCTKA